MRKLMQTLLRSLLPGCLLALLFLMPGASMQGVRDGLALWADAVLPALLPFFVVTQLLQECGALNALSPLLRPICRVMRLPDSAGGLLIAGWLSGTPNGVRLLSPSIEDGSITPSQAARFVSAATVTSPLFLIGTAGQLLGSPALGAIVYGIHFLCALCNGILWQDYGDRKNTAASASSPAPERSFFLALPDALRTSCLSVLFVGAAIAFFSALTAVLEALGFHAALTRILLFILPQDAIAPILSGFFEVSQGIKSAAESALSLPLRMSLLCAIASFGGLSVLCQAQVFLSGTVKFHVYFAQRVTHAILSFCACRALYLFFGGALPAFAASQPAVQTVSAHANAVPALLFCLAFSLVPWQRNKTAVKTQGR